MKKYPRVSKFWKDQVGRKSKYFIFVYKVIFYQIAVVIDGLREKASLNLEKQTSENQQGFKQEVMRITIVLLSLFNPMSFLFYLSLLFPLAPDSHTVQFFDLKVVRNLYLSNILSMNLLEDEVLFAETLL